MIRMPIFFAIGAIGAIGAIACKVLRIEGALLKWETFELNLN